jgi:RimJ/RimL family protein N-acetyltransferase
MGLQSRNALEALSNLVPGVTISLAPQNLLAAKTRNPVIIGLTTTQTPYSISLQKPKRDRAVAEPDCEIYAMNLTFIKLTNPTPEIAEAFSKWENDATLIPLMRPNQNEEELTMQSIVTPEVLIQRLEHDHIYLIYLDGMLVGEMNYQVDPQHLYKKEKGTAWIGIVIGEEASRGKGIGFQAMQYLEGQIQQAGLHRIELGVFEFNTGAIRLYQKLGYKEIARIDKFTFWQGMMRPDIRMEKYI